MIKQKYEAPALTVVTFKTERGFAASGTVASLGDMVIGKAADLDMQMSVEMQDLGSTAAGGSSDYFGVATGLDGNHNPYEGSGEGYFNNGYLF